MKPIVVKKIKYRNIHWVIFLGVGERIGKRMLKVKVRFYHNIVGVFEKVLTLSFADIKLIDTFQFKIPSFNTNIIFFLVKKTPTTFS